MSILDELEVKQKEQGVFCVVGGFRLSGKSTLAGTLPGKTLLVQAALRETGSNSAKALAESLGNSLRVVGFSTLDQLKAILKEAEKLKFDNIYIDGISAITEIKLDEPAMQKLLLLPKGVWEVYGAIAEVTESFILQAKKLAEDSNINVFMTLALGSKINEKTGLAEVVPELKGRATLASIKKYATTAIVVRCRHDEKGNLVRELVTKNDGEYSARIDSLLDQQNPGVVPADLSLILKLIKGV